MAETSWYQPAGLILVRASTDPGNLELPAEPNASAQNQNEVGVAWLSRIWTQPQIREAVELASPSLALSIGQLITGSRPEPDARELRNVIRSAASYLMRWQRRATPFGMFAGIAAAQAGARTVVRVGGAHQLIIRADAEWLGAVISRLENHRRLRTRLLVTANSAAQFRDGRVIVTPRPDPGQLTEVIREISVPCTPPVAAVLDATAEPVRFSELAACLRARYPAISSGKVAGLLHSLLDHAILISNLSPPATATDGLAHLIAALRDADAWNLADIAQLLDQIDEIAATIRAHNTAGGLSQAAAIRAKAACLMHNVTAEYNGQTLAADTILDAQIMLPHAVLREAALAADVLTRLTTRPFGTTAWFDYHARFRLRYGTGALVPVRELLSDSGLGYPSGYVGSSRARPSWRMLTERDATLLSLIYKAAADRQEQIELTEPTIRSLTVGSHADFVPPQRVELGFELHACSVEAVDQGDFELWLTAAPRPYTSMAGRFAYLLSDDQRADLAASFITDEPNTIEVQLSFPPLRVHNDNVTRVPSLLRHVAPISEHASPGVTAVRVDDLAVTADAAHLYLVHRPTGQRVTARILHALDTRIQTPPLARFLAELTDARIAAFGPFDVGAARALPHIPRIRYRRTVLAPARWTLKSSDIQADRQSRWPDALRSWADHWHVPSRLVLCQDELRLPLDLDNHLDVEILRSRLRRVHRLELRESGQPNATGWIGRPAELLVTLTRRQPPARGLPPTAYAAAIIHPGAGDILRAELTGNSARYGEILANHLPQLTRELGASVSTWWVTRHRDHIHSDPDQPLAVMIRLVHSRHYAVAAAGLARWAAHLQERGLVSRLALTGYQPQPGRYGEGAAMLAAEQVFAADTMAAIAQIEICAISPALALPLTAASLTAIAAGFSGTSHDLVHLLAQETGPLDRRLREATIQLADPSGEFTYLRQLPGGARVVAAWRKRDQAVAAYKDALSQQRVPATVLRSLLHDHHCRALGDDPDLERITHRLARTAALRQLALATMRQP